MSMPSLVIIAGILVVIWGIILLPRMSSTGQNTIKALGMEFTLSGAPLVVVVLGFLLVYVGISENHKSADTASSDTSHAAAPRTPVEVVPAGSQASASVARSPISAVEESARRATTVTVMYGGDPYGCVLQLRMKIGSRTFVPNGSSYEVSNVPLGRSNYTISGTIGCPAAGVCQASGSGVVAVEENTTLSVLWQNTGIGQCTVSLRET